MSTAIYQIQLMLLSLLDATVSLVVMVGSQQTREKRRVGIYQYTSPCKVAS